MGFHFLVAQLVGYLALWYYVQYLGLGVEAYYERVVVLTGFTGILVMPFAFHFYRRDSVRRQAGGLVSEDRKAHRIGVAEILLYLGLGAGASQFGNLFAGILQIFLQSTQYQESWGLISEGQSMGTMIFWMGIVAPVAEEMIFRWLIYLRLRDTMRMGAAIVVSALIFGIYHGNLIQAVYASLLGMLFAYSLEKSGNLCTSILLHIGANIWSLLAGEWMQYILEKAGENGLLLLYMLLLVLLAGGISYLSAKGKRSRARLL